MYLLWLALLLFSAWLSTQGYAEPAPASSQDSAESMAWPMLPGESVDQLAALFYPGDRVMQRRFAAKTRVLSATVAPDLDTAAPFDQAVLIVIPDIKSLSRDGRAFKPASARTPAKLRMSYQIKDAASVMVTPEMEAEYENLSRRNQALKDNLQRLNAKLAKLQLEMATMLGQATPGINEAPVTRQTEPTTATSAEAGPKAAPLAPTASTEPLELKAESALTLPSPPANPAEVPPSKAEAMMPATAAVRPVVSVAGTAEDRATSLWLDEDLKVLLIQFVSLVLGLILALFAWRWLRKQLAKRITKVTDEQLEGLRMNTFSADESGFFNTQQPFHVADDMGVLSVEEFDSVVDEARILVSMDRINEAISLLRHHIEEQPRASLQPWIYLLDLYRTLDRKDDFSELARRFHQTFNVMAPQWEHKQVAMVVATTLEEFPHIIDQLLSMWPNPEAKDYLEALIKDNREGERAGFSMDVAKEIALLISILETRDS